MKFYLLGFFFLVFSFSRVYGQATFQSASGGTWNSASRWTLISGSDADGIPDANDDIILQSGHTITINANYSCNNLTFNGGGLTYSGQPRTLTVGGNVSVTATSSVSGFSANQFLVFSGNLTVNSGFTLSLPSITTTISGSTTLDGTLSINSNSRTLNFGNVIINATGNLTLSGGNNYYFNGDLTNNGTFSATSYNQNFYFTSSSGVFSGSNEINLFEANFNSPANYTNNGNMVIRDNMAGTGSFTNGNGGQLELQNGGPFAVSTFDASAFGNTITYTGYGSPTGFSGSYYNLVLSKSSGNLTFSGAPSILNDLTIQSGIFQVTAVTVTIGNDLNLQGGEFTPDNASAVVNIGGDMNISGGEYDHNNGDVNVTGNIAVTGGAFSLNGTSSTIDAGSVSLQGVSLTLSQGTWTTTGDYDLETGSSLTGNGAAINIGGTFNFNSGATANFTGGSLSANSIYVGSGNELFINAVNLSSTGTMELDGTVTFNNSTGTKSVGSILVNATGNWNVTQPLNITVTGDITNNGTFTGDPGYGTSVYTLTSASGTIGGSNPLTIRDITINTPGDYTNTGNLTVGSTLTGSGSFTNGAGATFIYRGNNSSGTNFTVTNFTASAVNNTVVFAGLTYNQQWRATTSANNDYYNVTINTNTGDYQHIVLAADVRVNGTLTFSEGFVQLNGFDLEMAAGATITGGTGSNYIKINSTGVVRQYFSSVGSTLNYPIGDANNYSPITSFTVNSATLGANPYVDIDVTDANHPNRNTNNLALGGNDDGVTAVDYISRYWTLTGNDMSNPNFDVSYVYTDGDITGTESNMIAALYGQPPGETFNDWKDAGIVNATNNTATITGGNYWGDLYAMDNNLDRLPIELLSFNVKVKGESVVAEWLTLTETNNSFFSLERSADGQNFKEIGFIDGAGTTDNQQSYVFEDKFPLTGRSYYRLKQTDFNGDYDYSEVISVDYQKSRSGLSANVFPNPVISGNEVYFSVKGIKSGIAVKVDVVNQNGRSVWSKELDSSERDKFQMDTTLAPGLYVVYFTSEDGQRLTKKLIVR